MSDEAAGCFAWLILLGAGVAGYLYYDHGWWSGAEVTAYPVRLHSCNGDQCSINVETPRTYTIDRVNSRVFYLAANSTAISSFSNCMIVDRQNWQCDYAKMLDGKFCGGFGTFYTTRAYWNVAYLLERFSPDRRVLLADFRNPRCI